MVKWLIFYVFISLASAGLAMPNVDIMFSIRQINTRVWAYDFCENDPKLLHPYKNTCFFNQWNVGSHIDRDKIRKIPYATINPPNPLLETHTFWLIIGGGGVIHCIDDFEEGPVKRSMHTGKDEPCFVIKNYEYDPDGHNYLFASVRSQCESCSLTPGPGYGMIGTSIKFIYSYDYKHYLYCHLPCVQINLLDIDLFNLYPCDPTKVYGCQPGEYH